MVAQSHNCQPADGDIFPNEQTWGKTFAVPLVGADGANNVFGWRESHWLSRQPAGQFSQSINRHFAFFLCRRLVEFRSCARELNLH